MQGRRLFLALAPDPAIRAVCYTAGRDLAVRMQPARRRTIPAENLHLTLEFLGHAVTPDQEAAVRAAAGQVAGAPFTLVLDVAGSFAGAGAWWLGTREVPPLLTQLRADLHRRLTGLGLHLDRARFTPHVTVLKSSSRLPPTRITPIQWQVVDFVLMLSRLGPEGSSYEILQRWPLQTSVTGEQLALL